MNQQNASITTLDIVNGIWKGIAKIIYETIDSFNDKMRLKRIPKILNDNIPLWEDKERINNEDDLKEFILVVLKELEDFYKEQSKEIFGFEISNPKIVFFDKKVSTECWDQTKYTWPFYCPGDETIYINLSKLLKILEDVWATWDVAIAYIIGHEYGHHFHKKVYENNKEFFSFLWNQNKKDYNHLKIMDIIENWFGENEAWEQVRNKLSIFIESWADYLSWAFLHNLDSKWLLHPWDINEAFGLAEKIWDDVINKHIHPSKHTHGTANMRELSVKLWVLQWTAYNSTIRQLLFDAHLSDKTKAYKDIIALWEDYQGIVDTPVA